MTCLVPDEIHVGAVGLVFEITVMQNCTAVDISTATTMQIYFLKNDGVTVLTKTAVFTTDGSDGKMKYVTIAGDLDQVGDWKIQGNIITPTWATPTSIGEFEVEKNLV